MVSEFRDKLCSWLDTNYPRECDCITWKDDEQIPLGFETPPGVFSHFKVLKQRTPWLALVQCPSCGSYWYVATDTVEDSYYLLRLAAEDVRRILEYDDWPDRFDGLKYVWRDRECRPTRRGADAHPCALNQCALPAQVSVIQAGLASGGGWARLPPTVSPFCLPAWFYAAGDLPHSRSPIRWVTDRIVLPVSGGEVAGGPACCKPGTAPGERGEG